jgi:hypothetical protein
VSYFTIISFIVPQSMMVLLDIVKVGQSLFMQWDPDMAADRNNVRFCQWASR